MFEMAKFHCACLESVEGQGLLEIIVYNPTNSEKRPAEQDVFESFSRMLRLYPVLIRDSITGDYVTISKVMESSDGRIVGCLSFSPNENKPLYDQRRLELILSEGFPGLSEGFPGVTGSHPLHSSKESHSLKESIRNVFSETSPYQTLARAYTGLFEPNYYSKAALMNILREAALINILRQRASF